MKKIKLIYWVISFGLLIVGTIMAGVAFAHGGARSVVAQNGTIKLASKTITKKTLTTKQFTGVKVDLADVDVIIKHGKNYAVTYQGVTPSNLQASVTNGQLVVSQVRASSSLWFVNLSPVKLTLSGMMGGKVVITTPKALQAVNLTTNTADITVQSLTAQSLVATTEDGDITLHQTTSHKATLTNSDGDIDLAASKLAQLNATSDDGDIALKQTTITNGGSLATSDGDINITGKIAAYVMTTSDGTLSAYGKTNDDGGSLSSHATSANVVRMKTSTGDINLTE